MARAPSLPAQKNNHEDVNVKKLLTSLTLTLGALAVAAPAQALSTYASTKYPLVLVHGGGGFVNIGGGIPYFYGIPEALSSNGANVLVPEVSSLASTTTRGEQLRSYLATYFAIHPEVQKVNLIGHSYGAPTIRYVAAVMPGRIASVTTVSGTNNGNTLADTYVAAAGIPIVGGILNTAVQTIGNTMGTIINALSAGEIMPQDTLANLREISTAGATAFNASFPAGVPTTPCGEGAYVANGVRYYSWGGDGALTEVLDPTSYALSLTDVLSRSLGSPKTDGLVSRCESHLGKVIRDDYFMNHLDAVNHVFGLVSIFETNPKTIWLQHANRLKNAGL